MTERTHKDTSAKAEPKPRTPQPEQSPLPVAPSVENILMLQRLIGNQAVGRMMGGAPNLPSPPSVVQRGIFSDDRTPRQKIDDALRTQDAGDVKDIEENEIHHASDEEKIRLIRILAYQGWVGPRDETKIEQLWASFGELLPGFVKQHIYLWNHCLEVGAELEDLQKVKTVREKFKPDVKAVANQYMIDNRALVETEMQRLGISAKENAPEVMTPDQGKAMLEMQEAAQQVARLQAGIEKLSDIEVGSQQPMPFSVRESEALEPPKPAPMNFSPFEKPHYPASPENPKQVPWDTVKFVYDFGMKQIATITDRYPLLYAVSREGASKQTQAFGATATPEQARSELGTHVRKLIADINGAQEKLAGGQLDPFDLRPIHDQLFKGKAGQSGTQWNEPFNEWAGKYELKDHEMSEFWTNLGLSSLAAAAFLLAPFTGGASLLVMTVGLGATAIKSGLSEQRYEALAQAAQTAVNSERTLVDPQTVHMAKIKAQADKFELIMAAVTVGAAAAAEAVAGMRAAAAAESALSSKSVTPGTNGKILWGTWDDYPKVMVDGQECASIGGRAYGRHAVNRMQPSGMPRSVVAPGASGDPTKMPGIRHPQGTPANKLEADVGRSISPNFVEDTIRTAQPTVQPNGNTAYTSGSVKVVVSPKDVVITIETHH